MPVDSGTLRDLQALGADDFLALASADTLVLDELAQRLQRRYAGPRGPDYDTAFFYVDNWDDRKRAGRRIQGRRGDTTADSDNLPTLIGCGVGFRYVGVARIKFEESGLIRSYPVVVESTFALGKISIQRLVEYGLPDVIQRFRSRSPRRGGIGEEWDLMEPARVTEAASCG